MIVAMGCRDRAPPTVPIATEPWALATYAPDGVVMSLGVKLAFVANDGVVRWRSAVASTRERESLTVAGDSLLAFDEHGVRALDLATGRERWHRATAFEKLELGEKSVAIETKAEAEIVDLATGATSDRAAMPSQWVASYGAGFVLADDAAVWAVGGARWRVAIDKPTWIRFTKTTAIVHTAAHAWWELALASGSVVDHGMLPVTSGEYVFGDSLGDRFDRIGAKTLTCTDARGKLHWRAAIEDDGLRIKQQITDESTGRVALIDELGRPAYLIDLHGSVHEPHLAKRFIGFSGPCALIERSELIVDCMEVATGLNMWSIGKREDATVCPLAPGALLVDRGRIVRIDGNGKSAWHVDLPDDAKLECATGTVVITSGSDTRDDHTVHVLDVTSGKLTAVAL